MKRISELINKKRIYFDGGLGTMLQKRGLAPGELPEIWNITHPEIIEDIHRQYLEAGANVITTNTFGVNCLKHENFEELIVNAINCAKRATNGFDESFIAFDIGPLGRFLEPIGDLPFEDAIEIFAKNVRVANRCGADLIIIETMTDSYETKAAVIAAKENSGLPIFVTNVYDENGKLLTGATVEAMIAMLEGLGVSALGMNCSLGPDKMLPLMNRFSSNSSLPVIVNPNAGLPSVVNGKTVYSLTSEEFADSMVLIANSGANILGGCCGTEPDYIKAMIEKTRSIPLNKVEYKEISVISSIDALKIENDPILIGERINPTGKPKLKQALQDNDINYILQQALSQADSGAHALDINVGLPEIDEALTMMHLVKAIQSVCNLPLSIDSNNPKVLEQALRSYNGKALVNSINGDDEVIDSILPIVKKYGGVVIALTLNKNGIPSTVDGRVRIAQHIIERAKQFGIDKKDIIFDPLALTISSDPDAANVTLKTVEQLTKMGYKTNLGVSNISFGLPNREIINASFLTMALQSGLSCAIMNPASKEMMNAYYSYRALTNKDPYCSDFIANSFVNNTSTAIEERDISLKNAIINGLVDVCVQKTRELINTHEPIDIINEQIIPALDEVGIRFEDKKIFLPQLLMSAECSSKAFDLIKVKMPAEAQNGKAVILATVKGDIHDIGKNIVKLLLESYGFVVYDLGKDVSSVDILGAVEKFNCKLVGLSALMTTTLPAMRDTVHLLKKHHPEIKIMVGGAVLTEEYSKSINADFYGKDAMSAVRFAEEFYK